MVAVKKSCSEPPQPTPSLKYKGLAERSVNPFFIPPSIDRELSVFLEPADVSQRRSASVSTRPEVWQEDIGNRPPKAVKIQRRPSPLGFPRIPLLHSGR
jgi:hypothetical protein